MRGVALNKVLFPIKKRPAMTERFIKSLLVLSRFQSSFLFLDSRTLTTTLALVV
jgi:hypothetical protein